MDVSSLYIYPILTAATVPSSQVYAPQNALKYWIRPLLAGELPTDIFTYVFYPIYLTTVSQPGSVIPPQPGTMTKLAASIANVPSTVLTAGSPPSNQPVLFPPCDPTKLPAGASVVENPLAIFNGLPLIKLAPIAPSIPNPGPGTGPWPTPVEDPNILQILAEVSDIQTKVNAIIAGIEQLLSA